MKFKFINFQIDKLKKISGIKTIKDPIRNICITYSDGYQETFFIDGSIQKKFLNGIITLNYEDGTKETSFPDGRVWKINKDGKVDFYK